jgi:molybdenum cofactor biosynthesis enzyme MoaA
MKIQTCPFCVSKMTETSSITSNVNFRNLRKACKLAVQCGVTTALITGKGEPTLYKEAVLGVCSLLQDYFPFIELQTNGYLLTEGFLKELYYGGLTTVILSMVHFDDDLNNKIYQFRESLDIKATIKKIHAAGLSVRLSCIMLKGFIDSFIKIEDLMFFCKLNEVEQVTIRSIEVPKVWKDPDVWTWANEHKINETILKDFALICTPILHLAHGAEVYDYKGQNLCISNCLTHDPNPENMRQLIFFPDGHLYYDWVHTGAILM